MNSRAKKIKILRKADIKKPRRRNRVNEPRVAEKTK